MSQLLIRILNTEISRLKITTPPCPVLPGTLPGERHGIGLLMASAVLASENVASINEVSLDQLVCATEEFKPDVVGLTFSTAYHYGAVRANLLELSERLPETTKIWARGESILRIRKLPFGIEKIKSLDELPVATLC